MDYSKTFKIKTIKKTLFKTMKNKIDLKFIKEENINMGLQERYTSLSLLQDFKKNGMNVLQGLNENELSNLLMEANKAYYNDNPLMTDNEYDIVKEFINKKNPKNNILLEVGAPVERNKVELPYYMGSMDKIKPDTNAMNEWKKDFKGSYILSCKLDGVSGLFENKDGIKRLFTRGDGLKGQDISYLIPHLKLPKTKDVAIRGEFIIPKEVFENKYKGEFANPRNMVAGIINQKKIDLKMKDIHFVAYELIEPIKKPLEQMKFLNDLDIDCVFYKEEKNISNEVLSELLVKWRKEYVYEIDGIIVSNNDVYKRVVNKNPEHSFAFKMILLDQVAESKVVDVLWAASKDGYLKPRIRIEPVYLGGVKIEYATGFNGLFIQKNKIGVGAVVEIIRSGDVIPHIKSVTSPAEIAKMPDVPYKWNSTNVDVLLENIDLNETVREKVITGFFKRIGVDGLGEGNVIRLINAGYNSISKILKMKLEDFLNVEGFKGKLSSKIYEGIQIKIEEVSLVTLMSASNIFGRGFSEKKLELIINDLPTILTSKECNEEKIKMISLVKGMAEKSAEAFVENIEDFVLFLKECGLHKKLFSEKENKKEVIDTNNTLFNKNIVITGFRDKNLVDELKKHGAKNASSVSKNTFVLIVKDKDDKSGKIMDAEELKIPIMTVEEFRHHYLSN